MSELLVLKAQLLQTLAKAQEKRREVNDDSWIEHEFTTMLNAVNIERVRRRLSPTTRTELQLREQQALGHVDYSSKFALYCAELALGLPNRGP